MKTIMFNLSGDESRGEDYVWETPTAKQLVYYFSELVLNDEEALFIAKQLQYP